MLYHLRDTALKVETEDVNMTKVIKEEVLAQLDKKYDNDKTMQLMRTATLLNPRYKGYHLAPVQLDFIKTKLQVEMVEFWSEKRAGPPAVRVRVEEDEEEERDEAPQQPVKKTLGGLLGRVKPQSRRTPEQMAETEMDIYISEDVTEGEDDPLTWWKENEKRFPLISNMARKYLCIPATSTPSERVYSFEKICLHLIL